MSTRTTQNIYEARNILLKHMGYATYQVYLDSELWREIRKRVMTRDKFKCKICDAPAEAVHHVKYDQATMLGTTIKHLASICNDCHEAVEFKDGVKLSGGQARQRFLSPSFRKDQKDRRWHSFNDRKGNAELDTEFRQIVTAIPRERVIIMPSAERHDVMKLPSGMLELKCPERMTEDDFNTMCQWLEMIKGIMGRTLLAKEEHVDNVSCNSRRESCSVQEAPLRPMMRKAK